MKAVLIILIIVGSIMVICPSAKLGIKHYTIDRDITSLLDRAQVSSSAEDMLEYMTKLISAMESRGMTKGHNATVFKKPRTDMSLIYKSVIRSIERLTRVANMNIESIEYQTALDDIRGTLRELDLQAYGWWMSQGAWMLIWVIFIGVIFIVVGWLVMIDF